MKSFYSFLFAAVFITVCLLQQTLSVKLEACGAANAHCWSTDDCCTDYKCYYADRSEQLEGFCERPAEAAKQNKVEVKVSKEAKQADSTTTNLRQKV